MRQFSLVSHYAEKSEPLASWILGIQTELELALAGRFRPYELAQIHCTIIGLEGYRSGLGVLNRYTHKQMDFPAIFRQIRNQITPTTIQIGGFRKDGDYALKSRQKTLYERSFSIGNDGSVVAMGWPKTDTQSELRTVDKIRRDFQQFNACHKYHDPQGSSHNHASRHTDEDNDIFFVIGKTLSGEPEETMNEVQENIRRIMGNMEEGIEIVIERSTLSIIGYMDPELPLASSFRLDLEAQGAIDIMTKSYPP